LESPEALAQGCAVLDMGAQTTTLAIYQNNQYLLNKVIAKGGFHISQLLEQQGISFSTAEKLKKKCGIASPEFMDRNFTVRVPGSAEIGGEWKTTCGELASLIRQVLDEIIDPLMEELNKYPDIRCLYVTGGGSMLQQIIPYLQSKTSIEVLHGSHAGLLDRSTPDEFCAPNYSSLVGALIMGSDYRDMHPGHIIQKPKIVQLEEKLLNIFTDQQQ